MIIVILIIILSLVLLIQDFKHVLKQEPIYKIVLECSLCVLSGIILNIVFWFII